MNCELNRTELQIPRAVLAGLGLADIALEAHMNRHVLLLMPENMTAAELIDVLEGIQNAVDLLLSCLISACRHSCGEDCPETAEREYDFSQVSEELYDLLMDNGCCPAALAYHLDEEDIIYGR